MNLRSMIVTAAALLAVLPSPASAQDGRGSLQTTARYVELRPLRQDTVARDQVTQMADGTFRFEGLPAACDDVHCVIFVAGAVEYGLLATQDVDFTAWGFGVEGLSTTVLLRARTQFGGKFRQPLAGEPFEAILAYAELTRGTVRLRAGRQRELSGLGFSGFDGIDVLVEPNRTVRGHLYAGRSLARAMQQPYTRAFRDVEERDFVRDRDAFLLGGEVAVESRAGSLLALRYQGEIWSDRAGLLSERALLVGHTSAIRPVMLSGSAEYDVGYGRWGKAHLNAQLPLPERRLHLETTLRRYLPFFEYWTIWGVFSPVAYHEAEVRAGWQAMPGLALWGSTAYRSYAEHHTQTFARPLETEAWRAGIGGEWRVPDVLRLNFALRVEGPVGAYTGAGDAFLEWSVHPRIRLLLHGLVLEQAEEFRLGAGVVAGGGLGGDVRLRDDIRVAGGLEFYRQSQPDRPLGVDWTQRRGWLSVRIDVGRDPGLPREEQ
jgi:hypothetical protein